MRGSKALTSNLKYFDGLITRAIADSVPDDPQIRDAMTGVLTQLARGMAR